MRLAKPDTVNILLFLIVDFEDVAVGTFTFGQRQGSISEFEKYFHELRYNNQTRKNKYWLDEYWQETHQCNLHGLEIVSNFTRNCTGNENNKVYNEFAPVQVVINAVYAIANAIDSLQKHLCPNTTKICSRMRPVSTQLLLEYIKNTTFEDALSRQTTSFNSQQEVNGNYTIYNYRYINGSYDYVPVGSWAGNGSARHITENFVLDQSLIQNAHVNANIPLTMCRPHCGHGQIKVAAMRGFCCWKCHTCLENEAVMNNTCQACALGYTPRKNATVCFKMDLIYINLDTTLAIFFAVLSVLGVITDLIFLALFLLHRHHPLIKASSREMCCIIFLGIATIFITSLPPLFTPTQAICRARRILAAISFTISYAPLLMKVWRIHGIFRKANKLKRLSSGGLFGLAPMLGGTFLIIFVNVLFSLLVSIIQPTETVEKFYEDKDELVLECTMNSTVFISIFAYNLILVLACTFYAFLTRHFPKNFNEAMYIGVTLYLTCVVWVIFFANYLNSDYSISRVYWFSGSSLVVGWITLLGLFAPKFYHVYTKEEVSREMLITWRDSTRQNEDIGGRCVSCGRRMEVLRMYSNNIDRNKSINSKISNETRELSLSKPSNNISQNKTCPELLEIGIENLTVLADTKI